MMATRRALPLNQWLALEDDVARHKAAITENFAAARAALLPPAPPPSLNIRWGDRNGVYMATMNDDGTVKIDVDMHPSPLWWQLTGLRPLF